MNQSVFLNTKAYAGSGYTVPGPAYYSDFGSDLARKLILIDASYFILRPTRATGMDVAWSDSLSSGARHNGLHNALFMDGHAGTLRPSEVANDQPGNQPLAGLISPE